MTARIVLGSKDDVFRLIDRGDELVKYFTDSNAVSNCDAIFNNMKSSTFIAKGVQGSVSTISLGNTMDKREYVVKKAASPSVMVESHRAKDLLMKLRLTGRVTFEQVGKRLPEDLLGGMSIDAFYEVNNATKATVVVLHEPLYTIRLRKSYRGVCKTSKPLTAEKFWVSDGVSILMPSSITSPRNFGNFVYPIGSYLCSSETYTEYIIGLLCARLFETGKCINFIDVYGFSMCSPSLVGGESKGIYDYTFMERIHGSIRKNLKNVKMFNSSPRDTEDLVDGVIIQTYFAVSAMQRIHGIQHNDLHNDNVMFQDLSKVADAKFGGKDVKSADYFSYDIDGTKVYFRNCGVIVKLADFGYAMKYSQPIVGPEVVAFGDMRQMPAWRDDYYDMMFSLGDMYNSFRGMSDLVNALFLASYDPYVIGERLSEMTPKEIFSAAEGASKTLDAVYEQEHQRPSFTGLKYHPWEYLTNPSIMKTHLKHPGKDKKIVSLGSLSSSDFHKNFFDGHDLPLHIFTEAELRKVYPSLPRSSSSKKSSMSTTSSRSSMSTSSRSPRTIMDIVDDAVDRMDYGLDDHNGILIMEGILALKDYLNDKKMMNAVKRRSPKAMRVWNKVDELVYDGMHFIEENEDVLAGYFSRKDIDDAKAIQDTINSINKK